MIPESKPLEREVLRKITPDSKEKKHLESIIESLKQQVKREIRRSKLPITLELVGSTAKDTYLRTAVDIDLFLVFPTNVPREILEEKGLAIGRATLEQQEECYAEHPYVRGMYHGYKTELVPCYKIESASQKLSAVDRTPLHTKYIKTHLGEEQKKEVRILKQFLKGIGCYGAEAEVEGFSGYLCELMIIKYGTFQKFIENTRNWHFGETLTLIQVPHPQFETPLIFIDPVDSERNVASAVSREKFTLVRTASIAYAKKPKLTFFFPKPIRPWSLEKIKKKINKNNYVGVAFARPKIISENLYPQIRKAVHSIMELCEQNDFDILQATYFVDETSIYIILKPKTIMLSKTVLHEGPPLTLKKNVESFWRKWANNPRTQKQPFKKNKRLYVEIKREYTNIKPLLHERVRYLNLGKHINNTIRDGYAILDRKDLLTAPLRMFWTTHLDTKMTWEY